MVSKVFSPYLWNFARYMDRTFSISSLDGLLSISSDLKKIDQLFRNLWPPDNDYASVWTIFSIFRFYDFSTISLVLAHIHRPNFRNIFIRCSPTNTKLFQEDRFRKIGPLNYDYAKHTKVFHFHISKTFSRYLWYSLSYIDQTFSAFLLDVFIPIAIKFKKIGRQYWKLWLSQMVSI